MTYFLENISICQTLLQVHGAEYFSSLFYMLFSMHFHFWCLCRCWYCLGKTELFHTKPDFSVAPDFKTHISDRMSFEVTRYANDDPQRALIFGDFVDF